MSQSLMGALTPLSKPLSRRDWLTILYGVLASGFLSWFIGRPESRTLISYTYHFVAFGVFIYTGYIAINEYYYYKGSHIVGLFRWHKHDDKQPIEETESHLANRITTAQKVDILLASGSRTLDREQSPIIEAIEATGADVRILLLDPRDKESCRKRVEQLEASNETETIRTFAERIERSIKVLDNLREKHNNVKHSLYRETPVWRLFRIDHEVYVQSYRPRQWSWETSCFGFTSLMFYSDDRGYATNSYSIFHTFAKYFEELFSRAEKRLSERHSCYTNANIKWQKVFADGVILDRSTSGARVVYRGRDPVTIGQVVSMSMDGAWEQQEIDARVVWTKEFADGCQLGLTFQTAAN